MNQPYGTLTGMDFAEKKNKTPDPEIPVPAMIRTKYEKYAEKPVVSPVRSENPDKKEKTEAAPPLKESSTITPLKMFAAFFALACLMIVWIYETNDVREGLLDIERLKDEKLELEKTNESIRVDITRLTDYQRIEKLATEKLKMVPSKEKPGVIFLDAEKAKILNQKPESLKEP